MKKSSAEHPVRLNLLPAPCAFTHATGTVLHMGRTVKLRFLWNSAALRGYNVELTGRATEDHGKALR